VGSVIATRLWTLSLFLIFRNNPQFIDKVINDSLHHYQIGLVILILALPLNKLLKNNNFTPIGLGIFLEELPVFLNDLGFNTLEFYGKWDIILTLIVVAIAYLVFMNQFVNTEFKSK